MYMRIFHPFAPRFSTMPPAKDEASMSGRLDVSEKLRIDRPPVLHSMYIFSLQFILILRVLISICLRMKERVGFQWKECVRKYDAVDFSFDVLHISFGT